MLRPMMKRKQISEPKPAADALAALNARLGEIHRQCEADKAELVRLEKLGIFSPSHLDAIKVSRAARELLNGAADGLLPPVSNDYTGQIHVLRHNIRVATQALEEGNRLIPGLQRKVAAERFNAHAAEIRAAFDGIVDAIISLEHAQQRRDALLRDLKLPADMVPSGWPLLGRLGRSESTAYRTLQAWSLGGWVSAEKFEAEVARSRKALAQG
jgi:hypothetical protein